MTSRRLPVWFALPALLIVWVSVLAGPQLDADGLTLEGVVRAPGSLLPMAGVRLTLRPQGVSGEVPMVATTDTGGRFSFRGLGAGRWVLTWAYPDRVGSPWQGTRGVEVSESGPGGPVALWLAPLARVSGRVWDPDGEPLVGACVDLTEAVWARGESWLIRTSVNFSESCQTDQDGRYELMAPEGSYYLLARVDATGLASPQYYPGVVDPRQAPRTRIGGGMDLGGMDLHLVTQPLYRIRFQLPAAGEHPGLPLPDPDPSADSDPRIDVSLRSVGPGVLDPAVTLVDLEELGDGMYRTSPIPPGEYDMMIRYRAVQETNFHEGSFVVTTPIDRFRVVVTDEDVDLGAVSASPRVSVRGRVEVRTTRAGRPAPARVTQVALREVSRGLFGSVAEVGPDGAFAIDDLFPGVFAFLPLTRELPDPWYLAAVTSGARDVLRHGLETGGGPLNPIDVVIADDAARVTGVVRREDATLVPEARIVLIPPANRRGPLSSFPTSVADAGGVFGLRTVPPGDYRILALDEAGRQAQSPLVLPYWEAPDFLARYELRGEVLEIEPGGEIVVNPGVVVVRD